MKFTISKDSLLELLDTVAGAVEKKQTSKILENVLIQINNETMTLVGTDLEIEMSATIAIQAEAEGKTTTSARKFLDICRALPADCFILIETDSDNRLHIKGVRSRFELATLPASDFPKLDDIPITQEVVLPENVFKRLLDNVSFSMANQDVRYYLNGLLMDFTNKGINSVATDGHRLAISEYVTKDIKETTSIIVPRKAILELSRLLNSDSETNLTLQISDNHIRIEKDAIRFTSKLIEGKYPDYDAAIPKEGKYKIELNREQFKDTLQRVAILSNEKFRGVRLRFTSGMMTASTNNPENELAEEEIDIQFSDELFEIGFNVNYLLDAVAHLQGETIFLCLTNSDSSALLYSEENMDTRYVVMPIRL